MPPASPCPTPRDLQQLLLGQLPEAQAVALERHVEQCGTCLQTLRTQAAEDPLVATVRAGLATTGGSEEEVNEALLARLYRLKPPPVEPAPGDAPAEGDSVLQLAPSTVLPQPAGTHNLETTQELCAFLTPPTGPDEIGRLGDYRVLKVLGAGGMGVVFQAEDPQLQRLVALKAMRPVLAASPVARQRFLREARATAAVKHDHVVTIYQVGQAGEVPFLAMELLEGETLEARLRREGRLLPKEVLRIGQEIAAGLAAAHWRGLIHRDVKPANVWLEDRLPKRLAEESPGGSPGATGGRAKVLDFGLARGGGDDTGLTSLGQVPGTPAFMAPEQAQGQATDPRSDLFSLGCILYLMGTGELPSGAPT